MWTWKEVVIPNKTGFKFFFSLIASEKRQDNSEVTIWFIFKIPSGFSLLHLQSIVEWKLKSELRRTTWHLSWSDYIVCYLNVEEL